MDTLPEKRQQAAPKIRAGGALASLRPRLSAWRPEYPAPASVEILQAALAEADARLAPIDVKALTVQIERTLAIWPVPDDWAEKAWMYLEALEDVPSDLVETALRTLRLQRRWPTFPKPADLRAPIVVALAERRTESNKIAAALSKARRDPPEIVDRVPPTEADKQRVSEIVAEMCKNITLQPSSEGGRSGPHNPRSGR